MATVRKMFGFLIAGLFLLVSTVHSQVTVPDSIAQYALASPPSEFEWGCFGPCMCPVSVQSPLTGEFTLVRVTPSNTVALYTEYDVRDVHWKSASGAKTSLITGSGAYRRGGEVALLEQLTLDLSFDGGAPQHFDSGLKPVGAVFPEIQTRISLHNEFCHDSVLVVDALPLRVAGAGEAPTFSTLRAWPSPFAIATQIRFSLPRAGRASLVVFDLAGRTVRAIVPGEWLDRGSYTRPWDGRRENGADMPPGVYLVRLKSVSGQKVTPIIKLR